ncbi:hypothetical protein FGU71_01560 [Erythrobacter insulae]|uniref:DUF429 domain-containing protein n=1 Tax=Erythrobacter insulae TaxID=2584124 RepID=A0A547P959_9SPHN|nr:hypothetical protein [Erythrobacter insulae]TRD10680.1 hypothetical protein FGU71_01560 [Erythrobacter insulae]
MREFDHFVAIDWSGAKGERHKGIAIAIADGKGGPPVLVDPPARGFSRPEVMEILRSDLPANSLVGIDLGISLPFNDAGAFFPGWQASPKSAKRLWAMIDEICANEPHLGANTFVTHPVASRYFRHGKDHTGDQFLLPGAVSREGRFREAETAQRAQKCRPVSNFNLVGAAQVGKSSLTGMRMLHQLRGDLPVWPMDPVPEKRITSGGSMLVEIYTGLASKETADLGGRTKLLTYADLNAALSVLECPPVDSEGEIDDHSSDALLTAAWLRKVAPEQERWEPKCLTAEIAYTEGWTFGAL